MCIHTCTCMQRHAYTLISISTCNRTHRHCMWLCTHIYILADIHLVRHIFCNACTSMLWSFPCSTCVSLSSSSHGGHILHPASGTLLCSWLMYLQPVPYLLIVMLWCSKAGLPTLLCPALPSEAPETGGFPRWTPLGPLLLCCFVPCLIALFCFAMDDIFTQ